VSIGAGPEELRDCKQFNPQEGRKFPGGAKAESEILETRLRVESPVAKEP